MLSTSITILRFLTDFFEFEAEELDLPLFTLLELFLLILLSFCFCELLCHYTALFMCCSKSLRIRLSVFKSESVLEELNCRDSFFLANSLFFGGFFPLGFDETKKPMPLDFEDLSTEESVFF